MKIINKIQCAISLFCLSFSAHAGVYKCTLPSGAATFQDTPCNPASAKQETMNLAQPGNGSVLVATLEESLMIGVRVSTRREEQQGRLTHAAATCMRSLDASKFDAIFESLLGEGLTRPEIQATNTFFNGPTGRKYARRILMEVYTSLGEPPPEPPPVLNSNENAEMVNFSNSTAGQIIIKRKYMLSGDARPAITAKLLELRRSCETKH